MPAAPFTPVTLPTDRNRERDRTAVQAYLRLLHTVRAAFDGPDGGAPPVLPPAALAEAEQALREAGLRGNEREFFTLLRTWCAAP